MKRTLALLLILFMIPVSAHADLVTPELYLTSKGLIVIGEDSLTDENEKAMLSAAKQLFDYSICLYIYRDDTYGNVILWIKDGKVHFAVDMSAMLMDGTKYKYYSMADKFKDFCYTFEFDAYGFGCNGDTAELFFLAKKEYHKKLDASTRYMVGQKHYYSDYKQFFSELENQTSGF